MCANAREELRRPGFRGGGVGKPLAWMTGLSGAVTAAATVAETAFSGFVLALGVSDDLGDTFDAVFCAMGIAVFTDGFTTLLEATLPGGFWAVGLETACCNGFFTAGASLADALGCALDAVLGAVLGGALTAVLPVGLGVTFTAALTGDFATGLAVFGGFPDVFPAALGLTLSLAATFGAAFAATLAVGFTTILGLTATFFAGLLVFAGFAFTACLL